MKYFYITVTTLYDGYEWLSHACVEAETIDEAEKKANRTVFTHANGIEIQDAAHAQEITQAEFDVLKKFLFTL